MPRYNVLVKDPRTGAYKVNFAKDRQCSTCIHIYVYIHILFVYYVFYTVHVFTIYCTLCIISYILCTACYMLYTIGDQAVA